MLAPRKDVLSFGTLVIDNVLVVDRFPKINEDVPVRRFSIHYGGAAANVAVALGKLGGQSGIVAVAGRDFVSSGYREYLSHLGIDLRPVLERNDMLLPRCFLVSKGDDQIIYYYEEQDKVRESLFENLKVLERIAQEYKILHFSTGHYEFYREFLRLYERPRSQKISFDPGQQTFTETELVAELVNYADYLFVNEHEWATLSEFLGISSPFELQGPELVVVSLGERGSEIYDLRDPERRVLKIPAARPRRVVDPTGCGDTHRAAFLFGLLRSWDLETVGKFASAVASFVIEAEGAQTNLPTLPEAIRRYEENFGKFPYLLNLENSSTL